jgi:hypothetical protein
MVKGYDGGSAASSALPSGPNTSALSRVEVVGRCEGAEDDPRDVVVGGVHHAVDGVGQRRGHRGAAEHLRAHAEDGPSTCSSARGGPLQGELHVVAHHPRGREARRRPPRSAGARPRCEDRWRGCCRAAREARDGGSGAPSTARRRTDREGVAGAEAQRAQRAHDERGAGGSGRWRPSRRGRGRARRCRARAARWASRRRRSARAGGCRRGRTRAGPRRGAGPWASRWASRRRG